MKEVSFVENVRTGGPLWINEAARRAAQRPLPSKEPVMCSMGMDARSIACRAGKPYSAHIRKNFPRPLRRKDRIQRKFPA